MELKEFISALVAFLFGLIAKFIYDIWSERRKRKSLLIRKTILTSFTLGSLDKDIREQIEVLYKNHPIKSIQLIRVSMENSGSSAIKNQAITIRFGDQAKVIGEPKSKSSSEDLRYISFDTLNSDTNKKRILIKLLRKGTNLTWEFVVINHEQNDFIVEHGISGIDKDVTDSDLDVVSIITSEKAGIDVSGRIQKIIAYIILTQISILLRDSLPVFLRDFSNPIMNVLTIMIWILLIQEITRSISPIMEWVRDVFTRKERFRFIVEGNVESSRIAISSENAMVTQNGLELEEKVLKEFLETVAPPKQLRRRNSNKK